VRVCAGVRDRAHPEEVLTRSPLTRLLEGRYLWGDYRSGPPSRTGWLDYRLTVYPPGTNAAERRALQFWYSWPLAGALLSFLAFAVGGGKVRPEILVPSVAIGYLAGILIGWVRTRGIRAGVRRLYVARYPDQGELKTLGDAAALGAAVHTLMDLDARLSAGELTMLEYENGWWSVYDSLEPSAVEKRSGSTAAR
jgi:hypothetical protein